MQSEPATRELFVRPPRAFLKPGTVRNLQRHSYGIVEPGRQWLCVIEEWLLNIYGFQRVREVEQPFYKRGRESQITLLVARKLSATFLLPAHQPISGRLRTS